MDTKMAVLSSLSFGMIAMPRSVASGHASEKNLFAHCDLREDHIAWLEAKHILAIFKLFLSFRSRTLNDFEIGSWNPGPK